MQDLIKSSIQLNKDSLTPMPRTPPGEGVPAPTPDTNLGTPPGPTGLAGEPRSEIATVVEPFVSKPDWRILVSMYLRLGAIPDNKVKTWRLARRAKRYLIHDDELYHHSTLGILHQCVPIEEGKALLLYIHKAICGHHASSRSMVEKAFR
jgi:hypothetical protein